MKNKTGGFAIKEFFRLKPKMYWLLIGDNGKHKKATGVNETRIHNKYIHVWLNKKFSRHLMNKILSKNDIIESSEINKVSLFCLDGKIYILNNGYNGLALGYQN